MEQKQRPAYLLKRVCLGILLMGIPLWGSALHLLSDQLDNFVLEADNIAYLNNGQVIHASENIRLNYSGYTIYTDRFHYYNTEKFLQFRGNTVIQKDDSQLSTQALNLNATSLTGSSDEFLFKSDRMFMRGNAIELDPKEITAQSVWYSTCPFDQESTPIYHIRSSKLVIHPQRGAFVSNHTVLYLWKIPVFYFPRILYQHQPYIILDGEEALNSSQTPGKTNRNYAKMPTPELGQNSLEGYFIRTEFGYLGSGFQSGAIRTGFSEKLGFNTGIEHRIVNSIADQINLQANWYNSLGIQGYVVYSHDTDRIATESQKPLGFGFDDLFTNIIAKPIIPVSQFNIRYSYRELFHNSFVTFRPKAQWILKKQALGHGAFLNGTSSLSAIEETFEYTDDESRNPIRSSRWLNTLHLSRPYTIAKQWALDPSFRYYFSVYDHQKTWRRSFAGLRLTTQKPQYTMYIEYQKKLLNLGSSVFEFDATNIIETDEVGIGFTSQLNSSFLYETTLNINSEAWETRSFNHDITYFMDCISLSLGLDSIQKSYRFNIGVF